MIVIDIETTGLHQQINGIVSLGAVDFDTDDEFYCECVVRGDARIDDAAMKVNGFTIEQITDLTKPTQMELFNKFVEWSKGRENVLAGQQVGSFDILFLQEVAGGKIAFEKIFSRRSVDLHSVAYAEFGKSLSLDGILNELGLKSEPKPHNALTGARLEKEAFKLLFARKNGSCSCK